MNIKEIRELLRLRGWNQAEFARQLDLNEAAISRWLSGKTGPTGPTRILLRQWLEAARSDAKETAAAS